MHDISAHANTMWLADNEDHHPYYAWFSQSLLDLVANTGDMTTLTSHILLTPLATVYVVSAPVSSAVLSYACACFFHNQTTAVT